MLLANNLSFSRNNKEIFNDLNLSISPNKIVHIAGRNGIGKTTLIKILANVLIPKTGEIYWNGKSLKKNIKEFLNNLTYIMDIQTSKNEMTVFENIFFWKKLFSSKIKYEEINILLEVLNIEKYKDTLVNKLSYGEKRKLEISRLVIEKKKLWIFDEPYLGLDKDTINIFDETLSNHTKNKGMIIFSSHFNLEMRGVELLDLEDYADN
mgnify:CR=1 FL=1